MGCEQLAAGDSALSRAVRQDLLPIYFKAVTPPVRSTQNTGLHVENSATGTYQ